MDKPTIGTMDPKIKRWVDEAEYRATRNERAKWMVTLRQLIDKNNSTDRLVLPRSGDKGELLADLRELVEKLKAKATKESRGVEGKDWDYRDRHKGIAAGYIDSISDIRSILTKHGGEGA